MEVPLEDEILAALNGVGARFAPNELAYLALTSKVEGPIRDRMAFALHEAVGARHLVAREWDPVGRGEEVRDGRARIDLAILTPEQAPLALLELKAMYSFDDAARYCKMTAADEGRTRVFAPMAEAVYSLLLATHVDAPVPSGLRRVVKYDDGINRVLRQFGTGELVASSLLKRMDEALRGRNLVASGNIAGGAVHGLPVDVYYWLVRDAGPTPAAMKL